MAQGPINLSLFGSKVARGTPNRVFAIFFFLKPFAYYLAKYVQLFLSGDAITFNGQEQLCPLTCAGRRDRSNYTRMSTNSVKETGETAKKTM